MGKNYTYRIPATADDAFREYIEQKVKEEGSFPKFVTRLIEADIKGETPASGASAEPQAAPAPAPRTATAPVAAAPAETPSQPAPVIHTVNATDVVRKLQGALSDLNAKNNEYTAALVNRIDVMLDYFEDMTRNLATTEAQATAAPVTAHEPVPEPASEPASAPVPQAPPVSEEKGSTAPVAEPTPVPAPAAQAAPVSEPMGAKPAPVVPAPAPSSGPSDDDSADGEMSGLMDDDEFLNGAMLLLSD